MVKKKNTFKVIDIFSGAGGLSLGLTWAGLDVICAVDNNEFAVKTYQKNFEHPILCEDMKNISKEKLYSKVNLKDEEVDVLVGGPPCQGFSIRRKGSDSDPRNELIFEYVRLVKEIRPKLFLVENVPGILGKRGENFLNEILKLEHEGYLIKTKILDASDYGVPQNRKRVFIVGERLLEGKSFFEFPKEDEKNVRKMTVREALVDLPSPLENHKDHPTIPNHKREKISEINQLRISYVPQGGGREYIPEHLQLECHKKASVEKAGHRYSYGRLAWDEPAGTITARFDSFTRGKFAHPEENRTITLREGARLQSFPDDFEFIGSKVEVAKQIGNAVPPLLAKVLGECLISALIKRNEKIN